MQNLGALILPIGFLAVFYFFAIRPQRKKEKEIKEMRDNLRVGDDIITIGGIYGKVLKLKDDLVTIEIGNAKTRLEMTKWAIGSVVGRDQVEKS